MKISYLGTAAADGWPAVFCRCDACKRARERGGKSIRTRSQAMIDDTLLIDLPPDTYMHMVTQNLDLGGVQSLIVTHSHQDHFYPLELIMRAAPYAHDPEGVLTVYGNANVKRLYEIALAEEDDSQNFHDVVKFEPVDWHSKVTTADGYRITALPANHKKNERCCTFLIEKDGKSIFYGNDSGFYPEETWEALSGHPLDLVSFDSTMGGAPGGWSHMGLEDNIRAAERFKQIGCADENTKFVVNHFSHNGQLLHEELEEYVKPYGFIVSYDGMEIEI